VAAKKSWTGSTCEDAANLAIETGPVSTSATRTKGQGLQTTLKGVAASLPPGIEAVRKPPCLTNGVDSVGTSID
jgi:hypothetical protein